MELSKGSRRIFKQQQQTKLYSHTLNLNTIALQISKKYFLEQGKVIVLKTTKMSQHNNTDPCENMPLVLT